MGEEKEQLTIKDIRTKSIGELYKKVKLSEETLKDIQKIGDATFEKMVKEKYKISEEEEKERELKDAWYEAYLGIIDLLKKYLDLKEEYYSLVAIWIIGTYFHEQFYTYPYLFINAMKGSGKTRLLKLIRVLSKEGEMLNSLTEAVLFRTKGTLCIDEFERISRSGSENLRELLNSAYKKGTKVKRLKKKKTNEGEEQVVEEFDVYRPICLANIWGMESVLGDRCIPLILEKSVVSHITKLVEIFELDEIYIRVSKIIKEKCSLCSVVSLENIYIDWNNYITNIYTTTGTNNYTKLHLFAKMKDSEIDGRHLELALPLFVIADFLGKEVLEQIINTMLEIIKIKKEDEFIENMDVSVIDFVSQSPHQDFNSVKTLSNEFKGFVQMNDDWINDRWFGRALKRLNLIKEKKRMSSGIYVVLDITKAQEKIKIFK